MPGRRFNLTRTPLDPATAMPLDCESKMQSMIDEAESEMTFTRESVLMDSRLSQFQKILLLSDGSVTELLCIYTGQQIRTRKIEQYVRTGHAPPVLGITGNASLLHRKIMLTDQSTNHVYAESVFVLDRLSKRTSTLLFNTDAPVGQLWKEEKCEMYREIVDLRLKHSAVVAAHFGILPGGTRMLSRTYVIWKGGQSLGVITEEFPSSSFMS